MFDTILYTEKTIQLGNVEFTSFVVVIIMLFSSCLYFLRRRCCPIPADPDVELTASIPSQNTLRDS